MVRLAFYLYGSRERSNTCLTYIRAPLPRHIQPLHEHAPCIEHRHTLHLVMRRLWWWWWWRDVARAALQATWLSTRAKRDPTHHHTHILQRPPPHTHTPTISSLPGPQARGR
jgi:hypothetical protein